MLIDHEMLVKPGEKAGLAQRDTRRRGGFDDKDDALRATLKLQEEIASLQERLYAESKQALLIVLQAMDTGGKDGSIRHLTQQLNAQGCVVESFKKPTAEELGHDYLWRVHQHVPAKGMIGIFNRSHYEDVLVVRVHSLVPEKVWRKRYQHIVDFERLLADEGTRIVKLFLHISQDEQKQRLEARLADPSKHWKFNPGDLAERARWDDYIAAYEEALTRTSTANAPWYVIPADRKWFRNWAISDILSRTLRAMDPQFPPADPGLSGLKVE